MKTEFPKLNGMRVGGFNGELFVVFDPHWWQLHWWMWWAWKVFGQNRWRRLRRVLTPWVQVHSTEVFETCKIEFRVGTKTKQISAWRDRRQYLAWVPNKLPAATRVAVEPGKDPELPSGEIHPLER